MNDEPQNFGLGENPGPLPRIEVVQRNQGLDPRWVEQQQARPAQVEGFVDGVAAVREVARSLQAHADSQSRLATSIDHAASVASMMTWVFAGLVVVALFFRRKENAG